MFKKNKFTIFSVMIVLLLMSTVGHAANYTYNFYDWISNQRYSYNWTVRVIPLSPSRTNTTPSVPVEPSKPSKPTTPSVPVEPSKPSKPTTPSVPVEPNEPSKPTTPSIPVEPNEPSKPTTNPGLSQIEMEVVRLVNIERQKAGLTAFNPSAELSKVARTKSEDMAKNNYFSHTSPNYGSPFDMMKSFGIKYRTAGENIAKGYHTAESVVRGWMNSSGHRANILNPNFETIGVGAYTNSNGTIYWTQMFTN